MSELADNLAAEGLYKADVAVLPHGFVPWTKTPAMHVYLPRPSTPP